MLITAKLSPSVRPGQVIVYNGFEPYMHREWYSQADVEPAREVARLVEVWPFAVPAAAVAARAGRPRRVRRRGKGSVRCRPSSRVEGMRY